MEYLFSALQIMFLRVIDVSMGTFRTLMTVQGKKYIAGLMGFIEVTIWVFAISTVFRNLDNIYNVLGYSTGFALGTMLGITIEQKIGSGFLQFHIISLQFTDKIADTLRMNKIGVTILPGEGGRGGVAMLIALISRKREKEVMEIINEIDPDAFISVQSANAYRGYVPTRK
jgi:uncharacterized protein YebE (UPF0316 family)